MAFGFLMARKVSRISTLCSKKKQTNIKTLNNISATKVLWFLCSTGQSGVICITIKAATLGERHFCSEWPAPIATYTESSVVRARWHQRIIKCWCSFTDIATGISVCQGSICHLQKYRQSNYYHTLSLICFEQSSTAASGLYCLLEGMCASLNPSNSTHACFRVH